MNFYDVTSSDDLVLCDLMERGECQVIATDRILACLMAAGRSVYSWDLVVSKIGGKLILDKRDGSHVDFLTVNETSNDPPSNEDKDNVNAPQRLGTEATMINQNFSQQVISEPEIEMEYPNPFEEDDVDQTPSASGAFRYRKFTLPGDERSDDELKSRPVEIIVRTEVNCKTMDGHYAAVNSMNEWEPKANMSWKTHLESQRGAVLATEIKNNSFKLAAGPLVRSSPIARCSSSVT